MSDLKWTKDPPTKAGWYWVRRPAWPDGWNMEVAEVLKSHVTDEVWVHLAYEKRNFALNDFPGCEWSGPLEPPA